MLIDRRRFALLGLAQVFALTQQKSVAAATQSVHAGTDFDITPYVNPELRPFAERLKAQGGAHFTNELLSLIRKYTSQMMSPAPLPEPAWSERTLAGRSGTPDVRIYIINGGNRGAPRPAILHTHGGGYIVGEAKSGIRMLQEIAQALDCVIVTVDYRLSPEVPFPGALDDNYAALKWLYDNAAELGADKTRLAVMGESAGGGHAAMLAVAARDRGEVPLIYQALIYPMLDDRTGSTRQVPPFMGALGWTPDNNRFGWSALLGKPAGSITVPYGAVPARLANLKGLPPAFIGVGTIDLFVNEDIDYARRLIDAGVAVDLNVVPGAYHGFDQTDTNIAKEFKAALMNALRRAFAIKA